ncbi:alpha/beta hydrolase [Nonomuraea gerenzanensis]|uniref:Probable exported protease n=1 Tax=Nonomuraea gerenzanensis TaxID=93944 RepID=A0A1M4EKG4_9ACTN|nr:alpha/beta hydrolase [Nonomuraea gerenzanensis]UBU10900.1 alpha/beta hydrolase [Nonomuraea gerenzanensis]SBO99341.1 probable exported protease [Nonomuraea gerenzanensis]
MRRVSAAALLLAAAAGCSTVPAEPASGPSSDSTAASDKIAWGACTDIKRPDGEPPARQDASVRCGKLAVPLDYAKPDGEKLDLALIKLPATGRDKLGSVVFNFGGPGASGVDTLDQAAKALTALRARYDLISFDPRGVERSSGVRCGDGREMDTFVALDTLPPDDETDREVAAANKRFAALCQQNSGKVLPYVGTANAARDMDRIRDAVGDAKLNYVGMSYGTQLGGVYATLFPKNVGRMVLDAPLDPTVTFEQRTLAQTRGFQKAYESFLRACVKETCALGKDQATANTNVENLLNQLTAQPLKVGNRQLTQGLASTGVAAALYSELTWPFLEEALSAALKGDGEALLYLADSYTGRSPDGSFSTQMTSFPAITCVDTAERPDEATLRRTEQAALKISPLFGSEGSGGLCRVWPAKGSDEARHVNATGSAPIVVVGGKGDPATPYEWAPKLTAQLRTATLVTYEGEGHGAYLSGSKCIQGLVDAYLIDGKVPAKGASCPAA